MADDQRYFLRVWYAKEQRAVMLSHLEVARTLERIVRRAQLPYAVSNGFSPHMKVSFGAALPVGVGGLHECFDVQLTDPLAPEEALARLIEAAPRGLRPLDCSAITAREPAASAAFPLGDYKVEFSEPLKCLDVPRTITVTRKKKEKTLDPAEFLAQPIVAQGNFITFTLESKPTGSLRADILVEHLLKNNPTARIVEIYRTDVRS